MTRKTCFYHIANPLILAIILVLLTMQSITAVSSIAANDSALIKLVSNIEDTRITAKDLAFFLVTHNFDATPKKGYVEVRINDTIYKLLPNGQYSGLANVTVIS